jgi:protein tyrosine phosphatase (PTP) superfamily phosphohydrolase (DUF442 family)
MAFYKTIGIIVLLLPFFLSAQDNIAFPKKLDLKGFEEIITETGNLYVSGQPDSASFTTLKEMGVTTIINLRTSEEMDNRDYVPFNEKEVVEKLFMKYMHIPQGGIDTPYSPEALDTFASTLSSANGKVLLHCTVAWRASQMYAAYLIKYKGFTVSKALDYARAINFGYMPIEKLLNKKMIIDFK